MTLDLETLRPAAIERVALVHPETGAPTDAVVLMAGPYTAEAREVWLAAADESLDQPEGHREKLSIALAKQDALIVKLCKGFEGLTLHGQPVTLADIPDLFATFYWIPRQVFASYSERVSFFGERKSPSSPTPDISASSAA